jgi:acetylornithine/succinyldiaminopimelate/putrescine aminotransferase
VPFNDLDAMEDALKRHEAAAVIVETIPATYGFPMPAEGYLPAVKTLCERHGALFIADEVQTGLMRTGQMWCINKHGVDPDILVTAKGISGGLYTLGCVLVSPACAGWLHEDGFAHISTGGGAELGCCIAIKVLEIVQRPEVKANVGRIAAFFTEELERLHRLYPDFFTGVRQNGLVMGLEFDHPEGAKYVMRRLYENGVWAIFSQLDPRVLQWKPGLLCTPELCREIMDILETSVGQARRDLPAHAA